MVVYDELYVGHLCHHAEPVFTLKVEPWADITDERLGVLEILRMTVVLAHHIAAIVVEFFMID